MDVDDVQNLPRQDIVARIVSRKIGRGTRNIAKARDRNTELTAT